MAKCDNLSHLGKLLLTKPFDVQAVEKLVVSKLLVENSNRRIFNVDRHAGMVSLAVARAARTYIAMP